MQNTPLILSGPDDDPKPQPGGQCDCDDGDCACSLAVLPSPTLIPELVANERMQLASSSTNLVLNNEFSVWFGPGHQPLVLNKIASEIVSLFKMPRSVAEVSKRCDKIDPGVLFETIYKLRRHR